MKLSIRKKITLIFVSLLVLVIAAMFLTLSLFLPRVYQYSKLRTIKDMYEVVNTASSEGTLSDSSIESEIRGIGDKSGVAMIVMDSDGSSIVSTGGEGELLAQIFRQLLFGKYQNITVIEQATDKSYVIERFTDTGMNSDYMALFGTLSGGELIMMRVAFQSINESVMISMMFILIVGLIAIIIGTVIIYFVSRAITRPILNLTDISIRMSELDFDARYVSKGVNEIDVLGENMNELSNKLAFTIQELKTANNELKLDLDRKEQIDKMRTDFLSNVSHELKTPLALIQGYAEGLKDCINDDPESRDFYCDVIVDESEKMSIMIKRLLELNQLEFGKDEFTMERFDITELVNGVAGSMSIMAIAEGITLEKKVPDEQVFVWADEFKIEEVITNYMSNAIHHIGGDKRIVISVAPNDKNVRISVFNTGNPIPEEDLSKLWDKFYKVDKSHSRQYGGNGIGLSIVKAIMDAHHQPFGVNNYQDGVEFWFELDGSDFEQAAIDSEDIVAE